MENIIKELVRIEQIAKDVTAGIEGSKSTLSRRIAERCGDIGLEIDQSAAKRIKDINEKCEKEKLERIEKLNKDSGLDFAVIENEYKREHSDWEKEIFESIISVF